MREFPTNICPLLAIAAGFSPVCLENRCAWWDGQLCTIMSLSFSLEELADHSVTIPKSVSAVGFDKKAPASSAKADEGKAEME